jgi:hypothetical protein
MSITFTCACGKALEARAEHAGRKSICPACRRQVVIPAPGTTLEHEPAVPAALIGLQVDSEDDPLKPAAASASTQTNRPTQSPMGGGSPPSSNAQPTPSGSPSTAAAPRRDPARLSGFDALQTILVILLSFCFLLAAAMELTETKRIATNAPGWCIAFLLCWLIVNVIRLKAAVGAEG